VDQVDIGLVGGDHLVHAGDLGVERGDGQGLQSDIGRQGQIGGLAAPGLGFDPGRGALDPALVPAEQVEVVADRAADRIEAEGRIAEL
jgi:hypothetical protein